MTVVRADAVVIGAGAGGLCAAARLAHAGLHTIVVDDKDRIGGRASTEQIDGFTVNIGAIAIELGGVFEETFNTVGAPLDIRTPGPASSFFIDGKLIDVGRGGWSLLLGQLTKQASRILEKFADARSGNRRLMAADQHARLTSVRAAWAQFERGALADQLAPRIVVGGAEQGGHRHVDKIGVAVPRLAVGEGELGAFDDDMDKIRPERVEIVEIEALEQRQLLQQNRPLAPRPALGHGVAVIV